jgi:hypothetical protein
VGLELEVPLARTPPLATLVERLTAAGMTAMVVMIDGALVAPGKPFPEEWRDVRVRTPAGTVTIVRRPQGVAVVVWGNADDALRAAQRLIADELLSC